MGSISDDTLVAELKAKYEAERERRSHKVGSGQFTVLESGSKWKHLNRDPWVPSESSELPVPSGGHTKVLVIGGGYGGLVYSVRLLEMGFKPDDLLIVDSAGGFGGTWYWNRYPGLTCDIEALVYMPLLEETNYIPKHRYSYGYELRQQAQRIARQYRLDNRGLFHATVRKLEWNDDTNEWTATAQLPNEDYTVRADFVLLTAGGLNTPKAPNLPGLESYSGRMFHTSRWDYEITGGSQEDPSMTKLSEKRVGIIGTGATGVQAIPRLAEWAKELYVFQRTPSTIDIRGNHPIDNDWWEKDPQPKTKGWQRARMANFNAFINDVPEKPENWVNDQITRFPSYHGFMGGPEAAKLTPENYDQYVEKLLKVDAPRQEWMRSRVRDIVRDKKTAAALSPWYPGWCKRPCFHDDFLQTFNKPSVHLVDTAGRGVDRFTEDGVEFAGTEYKIDVLVLATGYDAPGAGTPGSRARIEIVGRNGLSLDDKWSGGVRTLHGMMSSGFPNIFWFAMAQGAMTANVTCTIEVNATHVAGLIKQAADQAGGLDRKFTVEVTPDAEEQWKDKIVAQSLHMLVMSHCTPSYMNGEGALATLTAEQKMKARESALWCAGLEDFDRLLKEWRAARTMEGIQVKIL